jgi:hypothetical protein
VIEVELTNAEHRAAWTKPEMLRIDAGSAQSGTGGGPDFASEIS